MQWRFVPMEEMHGRQICRWRYPHPYDCYDWPAWEKMAQQSYEFADPGIREEQYEAVLDQAGALCGYAQFFPLTGWTRLGLGLRPDLCGRGLGSDFARAVAERAIRRDASRRIDLEVLASNVRAIRAYRKAGFVVTDTYVRATPTGPDTFHCMEYVGSSSNCDIIEGMPLRS